MDKDTLEFMNIIALQTKQINNLTTANEKLYDVIELLSKRVDVIDKKTEINHDAIDFLSDNFVSLCKAIGEAEIEIE